MEKNLFDQIVGNIHVHETEDPPDLINLREEGSLACSTMFTQDFRLRRIVFERIFAAQKQLPSGFRFVVFEAFRPRSRQIILWNAIIEKLKSEMHPLSEKDLHVQAERLVANPHGFGSGHQAGAAVDISLLLPSGEEAFMGTKVQEFNNKTITTCSTISEKEKELRLILKDSLESEGVINYPDEWWHFSYGDRLWAEVTGRTEAFLAPIQEG